MAAPDPASLQYQELSAASVKMMITYRGMLLAYAKSLFAIMVMTVGSPFPSFADRCA
jgi:hypothetical protein